MVFLSCQGCSCFWVLGFGPWKLWLLCTQDPGMASTAGIRVHQRGGCHMLEQPLIRRCATTTADGARSATEGDPGVGSGIWGLAAGQVRNVLSSEQDLLPPGGHLVVRRLLWHHCRAVDVVILHMQGLHLVNRIDGQWVLEPTIRDPAVQQRLHHHGWRDSRNVVSSPRLHL